MIAISVAFHRNGISGEPFHVVLFRNGAELLMAVRFDYGTEASERCAVLNAEKVGTGDIRFGSNSYRGDRFVRFVDEAIAAWDRAEDERLGVVLYGPGAA